MFGAADGFFGEGRRVHALTSESSFGRGDGEVGVFELGDRVEGGVFVEVNAARFENSGQCK